MQFVTPQLDDVLRVGRPDLKGDKNSQLRPCLVLEVADGYALLLPFSTQYEYKDVKGQWQERGSLDVKQPPYGGRDKAGWLAFSAATWLKLNNAGQLPVNKVLGYAPKRYADEAWQAWLTYCKVTGYVAPKRRPSF